MVLISRWYWLHSKLPGTHSDDYIFSRHNTYHYYIIFELDAGRFRLNEHFDYHDTSRRSMLYLSLYFYLRCYHFAAWIAFISYHASTPFRLRPLLSFLRQ
jgi:hypothetical protein